MMSETLHDMLPLVLVWALALMAGGGLGAFFFGGLWWTIRKGVSSKCAAFWFLGSWLLRTAIVCTGFYFVFDGHWEQLLSVLLGFVIARFIVTRLAGPPFANPPFEQHKTPAKEPDHAPES